MWLGSDTEKGDWHPVGGMQPEQRHSPLCTGFRADLEAEEEGPVLSGLELATYSLLSAMDSKH